MGEGGGRVCKVVVNVFVFRKSAAAAFQRVICFGSWKFSSPQAIWYKTAIIIIIEWYATNNSQLYVSFFDRFERVRNCCG